MKPAHITLTEAASFLGVSKATLRNWDRTGKLSAIRHPVNGYRLYDLNELKNLQAQLGMFPDEFMPAQESVLDLRGMRRIIARLHNILRDSDSQSNIIVRFDEMTKLLFAKVLSDRQADESSPFNGAQPISAEGIRKYYHTVAQRYRSVIPEQFSAIRCSDKALVECGRILQLANFAQAKFDVKGLAYEEIIRNTFDKGDHQQFFTPPLIVEFMVSLCEPYVKDAICDPASGTGGFLASIARRNLPYKSLTSIEIDERLSWVSGINMILHDGHNIESVLLKNGGTLGKTAERYLSNFDVIITNPPFGSDFNDREALERMHLGIGRSSRRRGILFIERCHGLLKDSGLLAIIIDEGVLNLPHAEDVRNFILEKFDLLSVVSLPDTAFMPYASVNASIMVLRKQATGTKNNQVFFARPDNVGRKPNGDDDIRYDRDGRSHINSDLPEVLEAWRRHRSGALIEATSQVYVADVAANLAADENGCRIDFQYHHPSRRASRELIASCAYDIRPLGDLCFERNVSLIPSQELVGTVIPYTGLAHIEAETGRAQQVATPANSLKSGVKLYEPGDILFAKMRPNLRKVAYVAFEDAGYTSPECAVLTVNKGPNGDPVVDPELLSILLRSDFVYGQIMHLIAGIGRPRISTRELRQVMIPLPPAHIQRRVKATFAKQRRDVDRLESEALDLHRRSRKLLFEAVNAVATSVTGRGGGEHDRR